MNLTLTGATGRVGLALVRALVDRGDAVTVLTRNTDRAAAKLPAGIEAVAWQPDAGPAPVAALAGRDAVVHLAGEDVGQRWTREVKQRIRRSREDGTRNLVAGLHAADPRPAVLVSASASGVYGPRGGESVDESGAAGSGWLAQVVVAWEREALRAQELGMRVAVLRTGVVLDVKGGALQKMLPPFRMGVGGPVAGGDQYLPWIHVDDIVGMYLTALDDERWSGPVNASAPEPPTNRDFSKALGRALHRPAVAPVPKLALKALYGEMSEIVTGGVNMIPARATELGYRFRHPDLDEALRATLD